MIGNNPLPTIAPDAASLYQVAANRLLELADHALAEYGDFHLALAGGSTPRGLYGLLARHPERIDWSKIHLYFGDERCVPADHAESNYRMVRESLLDHLPVRPHVHRLAGELPPARAASEYSAILEKHLPARGLDLVLLGLGDDGHVASLFPDSAALLEQEKPVVANYVAKFDSWRLTLTYPALNQARHILLLVSGTGKAGIIRQVLQNESGSQAYPVQALQPRQPLEWFLDAEAASLLATR